MPKAPEKIKASCGHQSVLNQDFINKLGFKSIMIVLDPEGMWSKKTDSTMNYVYLMINIHAFRDLGTKLALWCSISADEDSQQAAFLLTQSELVSWFPDQG